MSVERHIVRLPNGRWQIVTVFDGGTYAIGEFETEEAANDAMAELWSCP